MSNKFDKLQKVLEADSAEGVVDLAVTKITELTDSAAEKDKEIAELKKKLADEETEEEKNKAEEEAAAKKKAEEEGEDGAEGGASADSVKALKDANEKLKKENEELKAETKKQGDAVEKLTDSVKEIKKETTDLAKKQARPLFHDSNNDEIAELKKKRKNIYADSRGGK